MCLFGTNDRRGTALLKRLAENTLSLANVLALLPLIPPIFNTRFARAAIP